MLRFATCQLWTQLPIRKTPSSAGLDLFSPPEETAMRPNEVVMVNTGLVFEIPHGYVGLLKLRSSVARHNIELLGGVIDADYRGEVLVLLRNNDTHLKWLPACERYVQLVIVPCLLYPTQHVPLGELTKTERADGGFGSTGKK